MITDVESINIKNRTYHFFNDMINIEELDSKLLKIDKKSYKNINIYYIGYITVKKLDDYKKIYSVNPLYLIKGKVDGFIKEKNGRKYLAVLIELNCTGERKEVLKKYTELWDGLRKEIETINRGKKFEYAKDFMEIKFDTDDDLPLNKPLKFPTMTIVFRSDFDEDGKFYPIIYLDECLYES